MAGDDNVLKSDEHFETEVLNDPACLADPTVQLALSMWRNDNCTLERALLVLVRALAQEKRNLLEEKRDLLEALAAAGRQATAAAAAADAAKQIQAAPVPAWLTAGRQHGYPDCCIVFWHMIWAPLIQGTMPLRDKMAGAEAEEAAGQLSPAELVLLGMVARYDQQVDGAGFAGGYVPCPACLAKKVGVERLGETRPR